MSYTTKDYKKGKMDIKKKEVDLVRLLNGFQKFYAHENGGEFPSAIEIAEYFYELGLKHRKESKL